MKTYLAALLITFFASNAFAAISLGVGYSSYTSGQLVPALFLAVNGASWEADVTSTGVSSQYDYLSGYSTSLYYKNKLGTLLGQTVEVGFGGGLFMSSRGYRATTSTSTDDKSDFGFGPSYYVSWKIQDTVFLRLQSILGIGSANNAALFFQDVSQLSLGATW